jgi:hypothetical protein
MSEELPEEKSRPVTLVVQLVVIPLAVVAFCVALGGLFMWLTSERKDFNDYVRALQSSSDAKRSQQAQYLLNYIQESKRWQGIFDMTAQISGDREQFLARNWRLRSWCRLSRRAPAGSKTAGYLALVLGCWATSKVAALRAGLADATDTVKNCLGWRIVRQRVGGGNGLTKHDESSVRLMALRF